MSLTLTKRKNGEATGVPSIFSDLFNIDRFFDMSIPSSLTAKVPSVNIRENNNEFIIDVAAPGLKKEDFKVNVENHTLTISAEKETSSEQKDEKFTRKEYSFDSFSRSFALPEYIKSDEIKAQYENGVLKLTVPKKEEVKKKPVREISIS